MRFSSISFCFLFMAQSALSASPTLERIKSTNTIKIGYSEAKVPFSYVDKNSNQPIGYGIEISEKVVELLRQELNLPTLKVEHVLVTLQNRWDLHSSGAVDLACITTTNTVERQNKYVDFSYGYFVAGARMLVPKSLGAKSYRDLAGKVVGVPTTSASRNLLLSKKDNFRLKDVIIEESFPQAFARLKNGELDAVVYDDVSLAFPLYENPENNEQFTIIGKPMTAENYACTLQKGDADFKQLVNKALGSLMTSQEIHKIYDKWFMQPIPPSNRAFNFPMSDATSRLLAVPNDRATGQL